MASERTLTPDELLRLRERLDEIDDGIIDLIAERQDIVTTIGEHKLKGIGSINHLFRDSDAYG